MATRTAPVVSPQPQKTDAPASDGAGVTDSYANGTLLYHQTIIPTQGISHTVKGSFTLPGSNDLILVRHNTLELWTLHMDSSGGTRAECIHSCPLFATVLAAAAVPTGLGGGYSNNTTSGSSSNGTMMQAGRQPLSSLALNDPTAAHSVGDGGATGSPSLFAAGSGYDYLVLTSETGYATLLRYELAEAPVPTRTSLLATDDVGGGREDSGGAMAGSTFIAPSLRGRLVKVSEVCLGRSGARPTVPGARLAVDSRGQAVMVSALMRHKVVIPLRRTTFGSATAGRGGDAATAALAWLGAGGAGMRGERGSDSDMDSDDGDPQGNEEVGGAGRPRGGADEHVAQRQLAWKRRGLLAPRGLITFGSPIEAHRETVIFAACALDGFVDTSVFAVLEQDTAEAVAAADTAEAAGSGSTGGSGGHTSGGATRAAAASKSLVIYAYVPSLQQVQRTHLIRVAASAHRLMAVPAPPYGPGGVLVCTDAELVWYDLSPTAFANNTRAGGAGGVFKCAALLPRRMSYTESLYDPSIIAHTTTCVRRDFFMLLQDEQGDLFRVFLPSAAVQEAYDALQAAATTPASTRVTNPLSVHYFDTIPVVVDMVLFSKGYLLAATEAGPVHALYKVIRDGYMKESEYIEKRVRRYEEVAAGAVADTKRSREDGGPAGDATGGKAKEHPASGGAPATPSTAGDENLTGVKAEGKPLVTGKLLAALPPRPRPQPQPQAVARIIALYQPHRGLKHMALVQTYPHTPPIVSFAATLRTHTQDGATTAPAGGSAQPQVEFHLLAGRGSGSVVLSAHFGHATRREGRFLLPAPAEGIVGLLSAVQLQRVVADGEEALTRAQRLAAAAGSVLGGGPGSAPTSRAARLRTLRKLLATSAAHGARLWTEKLLLTTTQGTTAAYHVRRTMEPDTWTGFVTSERTLAAATLAHGSGYVQVTPRAIHVLAPSPRDAAADTADGSGADTTPPPLPLATVQPTSWTHRHGKLILAAAASPTVVLLTFAQGGGLASFDYGLTGTQLQQCDDLPTFPPSPAVSLLQPSRDALAGSAVSARLHTLLFPSGGGSGGGAAPPRASGFGGPEMELAAVATLAQEVYIMRPRALREPLERIRCGEAPDTGEEGASRGAIVSVLLTYLGGAGGPVGRGTSTGSTPHSPARGGRLFCFIGCLGGTLIRCELDPVTARVVARDELTCGSAPCRLIAGDGQSVCYVQSGADAWRCEVRDGVPKVVPWRMPSRPTSFAAFVRPGAGVGAAAKSIPAPAMKREPGAGGDEDDGEDDDTREGVEGGEGAGITFIAAAGGAAGGADGGALLRDECVVAVQGAELALFSAHKTSSGASSLEYSLTPHSLPLAGRRILSHTTRPGVFVILSTEHRGHGMAAAKRDREQQRLLRDAAAVSGGAGLPTGPIPLDAPQRALGLDDVYASSLQLFHEEESRLMPRYFFPEGEAVVCATIGSFEKDFGKEPVLIVGAAAQYTHGAGCDGAAAWTQGWLCAFRFKTQPGDARLRVEPLHRTIIRSDTHPDTGALYPADYPSAVHLCEDVGLLFVGLGENHGLRIYAWGHQQLLRRRHLPGIPSRIVAITTAWVAPPPASASTSDAGATIVSDLYHIPYSNPEALRRAREQRLLVFCATVRDSVIVASVQPGGAGGRGGGAPAPSFLLIVARDAVPRALTAALVVMRDGRTVVVADRFGNVTFLRVSLEHRTGFSRPVADMRDAELAQAEAYVSHEQYLEEVASHATGQLVTTLQRQPYDPSGGTDPALAVEMVCYGTALGAVGAYVPFVAEEDAALAALVQPMLARRMRPLLAPQHGVLPAHLAGRLRATAGTSPAHHVVEGDIFQVYRQAATVAGVASAAASSAAATVFSPAATEDIEEELERARKVEAARRAALGLPPRQLPTLTDLIAKQRALITLPQ